MFNQLSSLSCYEGVTTQVHIHSSGHLVVNNPLDLLCIEFLKIDPSKDDKENVLVLTDALTKFSEAFIAKQSEGSYHHKDL